MKITLFYGSVRDDRQGIKAARFAKRIFENRGHTSVLIDPLEYELPLLRRKYSEYNTMEAPASMRAIAEEVQSSDALVIVSGEYNHSVPPALKNMIDHFMDEYFWKPSGIITYSAGGFGGVRAAMALRAILPEVGMPTTPSTFPISHVQDQFDSDGSEIGTHDLTDRLTNGKFMKELEWWGNAASQQRSEEVPY